MKNVNPLLLDELLGDPIVYRYRQRRYTQLFQTRYAVYCTSPFWGAYTIVEIFVLYVRGM